MENFDKIEESITILIRELHRLRDENRRLEKDHDALQKAMDRTQVKVETLERKLGQMSNLEEANRKYASDQTQIRTRVKKLIKQLEKMKIA